MAALSVLHTQNTPYPLGVSSINARGDASALPMSTVKIGDNVQLPQGYRAVLRWVGTIPGRQGNEYAGVELVGPEAEQHGKHSGSYEGRSYFTTSKPGTGLFIPLQQLQTSNGDEDDPRRFFREMLAAIQQRALDLEKYYTGQLDAVKRDCDAQIKRARRSSAFAPVNGGEVEKERAALAAMQNEIINEREAAAEKVGKLEDELAHYRRLAGSGEDLEALVKELQENEHEFAQMRQKLEAMDDLKKQLHAAELKTTELELALQAKTPAKSPLLAEKRPAEQLEGEVKQLEGQVEQLEKQLDLKLLRESELEAENEELRLELGRLRAQGSQPQTPMSVPVPEKLVVAGDDSLDIAAGRTDWCSLCDRQGHTTTECPF